MGIICGSKLYRDSGIGKCVHYCVWIRNGMIAKKKGDISLRKRGIFLPMEGYFRPFPMCQGKNKHVDVDVATGLSLSINGNAMSEFDSPVARAKHIISKTKPLNDLSPLGQSKLAEDCTFIDIATGQCLYCENDQSNYSAYVLVTGGIRITDERNTLLALVNKEHTLFGELYAIIDEVRDKSATAASNSTVMVIPGPALMALLEEATEMRFAQSLGIRLRTLHGLSSAFSGFDFALRAALQSGTVLLDKILPAYRDLNPAMHSGANSMSLDMSAWSYALHRLPRNINAVFALVLSTNIVDVAQTEDTRLVHVPTRVRRRSCRMFMPGKIFVLMRPGQTDISDLVTCLCLHTIESLKLRTRLKPLHQTHCRLLDCVDRVRAGESRIEVTRSFLDSVDTLSDDEKCSLVTMFDGPDKQVLPDCGVMSTEDDQMHLLEQMIYICMHRGDYVLHADTIPLEVCDTDSPPTAPCNCDWINDIYVWGR